jgi:pimeloyl-ACP methyl ester carboxylesterase
VTLGFAEAGEGSPVVLLPGSAADRGIWFGSGLFDRLSQQHRTVAFDWRGAGESSRIDEPYGAEDLVEDVVHLFKHLSIPSAHVVGLSQGSIIAQRVALDHPSLVTSLVLLATWPKTDASMEKMLRIWKALFAEHPPSVYGDAMLWWLFSPEFLEEQADVAAEVARVAFEGEGTPAPHAHLQAVEISRAHDLSARLASISVPTLVVSGEEDWTVPWRQGRAVAAAVPEAQFQLLTGRGSSHLQLLERSAEVTDAIVEFLTGSSTQ